MVTEDTAQEPLGREEAEASDRDAGGLRQSSPAQGTPPPLGILCAMHTQTDVRDSQTQETRTTQPCHRVTLPSRTGVER